MRTLPLLAALGLAAAPAPAGPPRFSPGDAPPELRAAIARAERAVVAAACAAERRFGEGDPDASAARCDDAVDVPGVEVGRTSARLRNPRNAPPAWASAYVAETDGRRAAEVAAVAFDLGGKVGLLRPIEVRRRCLGCHAPAERIPQATRAWLSRSYPEDRATGYELGDLRGFWWAEAPTSERGR